MGKQTRPTTASFLRNILCISLSLVILALVMYPFLQYRQAIKCINGANVQYTTSRCIEVERDSKTGRKGGTSYFYRLYLENGMELCSIIGGNVDTSLRAYETLKTEFENAQCFNYVTITVFGIEEHWLTSAQADDKEIVSEDGLLQKLETEQQKRLFATWLCVGLFTPMIVVSTISIAATFSWKVHSHMSHKRRKTIKNITNPNQGSE